MRFKVTNSKARLGFCSKLGQNVGLRKRQAFILIQMLWQILKLCDIT